MATPNPFDQFDAMPVAREEPPAPRTANPFDQFDTPSSAPVTGANPFDQFDAQPVANANSITPDIAEQTAAALMGQARSPTPAPPPAPQTPQDSGFSFMDVLTNPHLMTAAIATKVLPAFDIDARVAEQQGIEAKQKAENRQIAEEVILPQAVNAFRQNGVQLRDNPAVLDFVTENGINLDEFLSRAPIYEAMPQEQLAQSFNASLAKLKQLSQPKAVPEDSWSRVFANVPTQFATTANEWLGGNKRLKADIQASKTDTDESPELFEAKLAVLPEVAKDLRISGIVPFKHPKVIEAAKQFGITPQQFAARVGRFHDWTPEKEAEVRADREANVAEQTEMRQGATAASERARLLEQASAINADDWSAKKITSEVLGAVPDVAATTLATMTAGPEVGGGVLAASVFPRAYEQDRRKHPASEAGVSALLNTAAESIGEIPVLGILAKTPASKKLMSKLVGKFAEKTGGKIVGTAIAEGVGEQITEALQIGIGMGLYDENVSVPEALNRLAKAGVLGTILGGGMGGAAELADRPKHASQQQDTERARIDEILGRTMRGAPVAETQPVTDIPQNVATQPAPVGTMQPPASTGSPPPASASKLGSAPLDVAQESATPSTQPAPALTPKQQRAVKEADERDALAAKSEAAGFAEGAATLRANAAQIRREAGLPAPGSAQPATAPSPVVAATPKTEVPPAQTAPPVSTPAPAPHAETVTQPGAAQAGGTTAPASKNDVDVDFLEGVARDYEAEGNTQAAAQIRAEAAKASAQNQAGQSAPKTKEPPAAFREDDDEVEQVREMFGLPPPPPEAKTQYEGEDRPKKPPDEAKQVFNQIAGNNPNAKKMLEKRIAKLPAEARQKVTDWIAERTKHLKNVATRIEENREGLNRFAESAGWAQKGGGITRKPTDVDQFGNPEPQSGPVTGRLSWLPHAPWFDKVQGDVMDASGRKKRAQNTRSDLPGNMNGEATKEAVRKALAGKPMSISERRHINGMLDELDNERGEAEKEGLDNFDPFAAAQAIGETHRPADEPAASSVDVALVHRASQLDEAAVERAAVTHEQDDAAFMQAIRDIIATHEQGETSNAGGEAVRGTPGREEAAPDFQLESPTAPAAKPAAQKVAPPQGELLPKDQTKQDLADHERAKDQKRSPGTNVPADEGGGLFSKENKQTDVTDVTELDDDIGTTAAMGPEASLSESEANSRNNKRDEKFTEPSTARENLMEAIGIDPTELRLQGGQEQFSTIRKAIMDRYGYKYIHKHASQVWRNASDHLLDAFESLQNMAAVMGVSPRVMSLNGKLGLNLQRNTKARGLFYPDLNLISIFDQQDVFAHEFGHAIDYNLMEERGGTMTPGGLSAAIRNRENNAMLPETVAQAYADLMTALYYDGAHIAQLIKTAEHQLEKAKTDKRRAQLTKRLENIRSGAWRGHEGKTNFYQRAKNGPMKAYLTKPTELIARSFEAYISAKIQGQKELGLTKFLGASNAIYTNEADAWIKRVYPQSNDRAQIFAAWDNLMGQLTREGIYDTSVPVGIADSKVNLGLMDPVAQAKMAGLPLTPDIVAAKNLTDKQAKTWHKDEVRNRDTIRNNTRALLKGLKEGTPDTLQHLNALMRSFGSTPDGVFSYLEGRFPKNAALRKIRDLFSDAQIHGRNKSLGIYRETQRQERQLVTEVEQRLASVGIVPNMSEEWQSRMWDIMHGYDKPANAEERRQSDQLRYEYDRLFKLRDQHGVGLGYTAERYMNRITHRAVADSISYQQDVIKLRKAEKQALLEKLKAKLEAAKTEEEQKDIRAAIKRTLQIDPVAATQAQIAKMKGADWTSAVTLGALSEDSAKERVFGPLADKMLKKYYVKDPIDLLSTYAGSAAREMVQKRRLGDKPNAAIQALLTEASQDLPSAYVDLLKFSMQTSLGMQTIGTSMPGSTVLSAYSTISNAQMLGRASIPNLSEPFGVLSKSLNPLKTLGDLIQASVPLMRSQSKKARYAAADRLGRLSGTLVDSAHSMTAQAQTTGDDTQGKGLVSRISQKTYRFNLLTPITAAQEKIINRMGLEAFYDAAESIRANDKNAAMYGQWLREHGIKNTTSFAEFLKGPESIENLTVVDTLSGDGLALANALHHYVTTTIQNPTPSTKMLMANRGNFGLIFRLTSWMSTNFVNWAKQNAKKLESARTGKYGDAQLTTKQRLNAMALPVLSTMGTMYAAQAFFVVARMMLTRGDDWDDRGDDTWDRFTSMETQMQILQYWGLLGWVSNVAIDLTVGARANRGLLATLAGPVYGPVVQDVERWIAYFTRNSDDTNQGERNVAEASYHVFSMMVTFGLGAILPQSKAYGQIIGFLWSFFGTSPQASKEVATLVAGPKKGEIDTSTALGREQLREKKEEEADAAEKKTERSADKALDRTFEEN